MSRFHFNDIPKLIVAVILLLILLPSVRAQFSGEETNSQDELNQPPTEEVEVAAQPDSVTSTPDTSNEAISTDEPPLTSTEQPTNEIEADNDAQTTDPTSEVEPVAEAVAPTIDLPSGELFPGSVTLLGTGEPGTDVELLLDGQSFVQTTVDGSGFWSATGVIDQPGLYEVTANVLDQNGAIASSAEPVIISISELEAKVEPPTFDVPVAELTSGELTLTGTGEPGSEVQIVIDGEILGTTTVDENGFWSWSGTIDEAGDYDVVINALDGNGNVMAVSEPAPLTVIAAEVADPPVLISPRTGDSLLAGSQTFRGTGQPETALEFLIDGEAIGTATVRDNGSWSFSETIDEPGEVELVINVLDAEGVVVSSAEPVTLVIIEPEVETARDDEPIDETGFVCQEEYIVVADDWLSKLSDKYYSDLFLYPAIVTATNEKNAIDDTFTEIENPDLIEPGWKLCIVEAEVAEGLVEAEN